VLLSAALEPRAHHMTASHNIHTLLHSNAVKIGKQTNIQTTDLGNRGDGRKYITTETGNQGNRGLLSITIDYVLQPVGTGHYRLLKIIIDYNRLGM